MSQYFVCLSVSPACQSVRHVPAWCLQRSEQAALIGLTRLQKKSKQRRGHGHERVVLGEVKKDAHAQDVWQDTWHICMKLSKNGYSF